MNGALNNGCTPKKSAKSPADRALLRLPASNDAHQIAAGRQFAEKGVAGLPDGFPIARTVSSGRPSAAC